MLKKILLFVLLSFVALGIFPRVETAQADISSEKVRKRVQAENAKIARETEAAKKREEKRLERERKRHLAEDERRRKKEAAAKERERKIRFAEHADEIKRFKARHGRDIYVGEGIATAHDLGEAKEKAKKRAFEDLGQSIKVRIRGTMKDVLKVMPSRGVEENFERQVTAYVNNVLESVSEEVYNDYPRINYVTVIVHISKEAYDEKVALDLQKKIGELSKYAHEGRRAATNRAYVEALTHYKKGMDRLNEYFGGLPLSCDLDASGKETDIGAFFETAITGIVQGIRLEGHTDKIVYSASGHISKRPFVRAVFEDRDKIHPISNLPLRARFVKGDGMLAASSRTGPTGEAHISVGEIDSSNQESTIQVSVDLEQLGLVGYSGLAPVCDIDLSKMRTIAYCVNFFNAASRTTPFDFATEAKSIFVSHGYNVEKIDIPTHEPRESDIKAAAAGNLDYLVVVTITASGGKVGDYDMYYSNISSVISAYKLPEGHLIFAADGPSAKGGGINVSSAGYDAYARIKPGLLAVLREKIKEIK